MTIDVVAEDRPVRTDVLLDVVDVTVNVSGVEVTVADKATMTRVLKAVQIRRWH